MVTLQKLKDETVANLEKVSGREASELEITIMEVTIDAFVETLEANGGKLSLHGQSPSANPQVVKVGQASERSSLGK